MAYSTVEEVKRRLGIPAANTQFDTQINERIADADAEIDTYLEPYATVPISTPPDIVKKISAELAAAYTRLDLWEGQSAEMDKIEKLIENALRRLERFIKNRYARPRVTQVNVIEDDSNTGGVEKWST